MSLAAASEAFATVRSARAAIKGKGKGKGKGKRKKGNGQRPAVARGRP